MAKLSEFRAAYYDFSAKASEVSRQLAFAGIAIVWVFRRENAGVPAVPPDLVLPTLLLAAGLAFDLLHYVVATVMWGTFTRQREKRLHGSDDDPEVDAPRWINWPALTLFALKLAVVGAAYVLLAGYLWRLWR